MNRHTVCSVNNNFLLEQRLCILNCHTEEEKSGSYNVYHYPYDSLWTSRKTGTQTCICDANVSLVAK